MNISTPFLHRPVATTLLTLGIAITGVVAYFLLPVAPLPQVDFPTISVQASLPGASPETMAATVATPLERSLSRIAGVTEMTSASSLGSTRITVQFDLDRDIDGAARDVQAAIDAAKGLLPTALPNNPTYRKVNPAEAPILILALTSDTMSRGQMYDAASTILAQKLSQVKGVGQVNIGGGSLPAVRVELNPTALNRYGIGLESVRAAIAASNANRPKGAVEEGSRYWQIAANDQGNRAKDYLPLIITYRKGAAVRLSDLGEVIDGMQDLHNTGLYDGKQAIMLTISKQPGANVIETIDRIKGMLEQLRNSIPQAINLTVVSDRSPTIRASLREVERTMLISIGLVILVVFLFLRNVRATLIPSVAVPVSLIGTFSVMYLAGYSLDNLSLMALTVATGFVVDDTIVVLENISRHREKGIPPFQAALMGTQEVGFTVLSMSLSLVAVFIPLLLMGGIVGRLFREFAVTLTTAIIVSLVVSLTASPVMCAHVLKSEKNHNHGWAYMISERFFAALLRHYEYSLHWALRHGRFMMILLLATVCLNVYLYVIVPKGFFPEQDVGQLVGTIQADQSISFQAMRKKLTNIISTVRQDPAVEHVAGFAGGGQVNTGFIYTVLKPLAERKISADLVMARLRPKLAKEPGAQLFLQPVQDINIGGRSAAALYQYTLQGEDLAELRSWAQRILEAFRKLPQLVDVNTNAQDKGVQAYVNINRDTAARLGVTTALVDATLNDSFGQRQISTIYNPLNQYRVVMEVAPQYSQSDETLRDVYVSVPANAQLPAVASVSSIGPVQNIGPTSALTLPTANPQLPAGAMVPLSAVANHRLGNMPLAVNHEGQFAASTISFNLPPGVSLSAATRAIEDTMNRLGVPASIHGNFRGRAQTFQTSLQSQPWLILAALVTIYIVLGVLYESYVHPLTILSTLPSAGVGALLALLLFRTEFSIMALIGVILLIGIVKKNAIMMIDFALDAERKGGKNSEDAIFEACLIRFRPILMTTMAALLGAIPLALSTGNGAELRRPLGISIVGGLIVSQMLTLYTTPVVYLYLDRFRLWCLSLKKHTTGALHTALDNGGIRP